MEVSFDIKVECDSCGATLETRFNNGTIAVEPCEFCSRDKYEEGLNEEREGREMDIDELKAEIEELKNQLANAGQS